MDRYLKERLVGAAVLVAAAVILIPEMLSGPRGSDDGASAPDTLLPSGAAVEANGVKTYTIDLSAAQRDERQVTDDSSDVAPAESAPTLPTVEVAPAPPPLTANDERPAESATSSIPPAATAQKQQPPPPTPSSVTSAPAKVSKSLSREPVKEPIVVAKSDGDWAVQVASFSARATADRIAAELKSKGFKSFVMPVQASGQTLYRVRVGPVNDRESAEALLKRVKPLHPSAAVVPQ